MRRRSHPDPVTSEVRAAVMVRDRKCFLARLFTDHICRDQWGYPHAPDAYDRMTVDHVKAEPRMGKRAPSDVQHLVLMCYAGNVGAPSRDVRIEERAYLRALYPEAV